MRLTTNLASNALAASAIALILSGCTNDTIETFETADVNLASVSNKVEHPLSDKIVQRMRDLNIEKTAPLMIRIFKEEGALEIWKANTSNRFQKVREYKICAWSGKLGPKVKEGDRQAPEGFYPLSPRQLNPNSSYYLAIDTGFPNTFDRANKRSGTNLMIHGACSSSGCYSMTDEQIQEIFSFSRDAFKGGQKTIQLQAFPFRMTAENMARHRDNPNIEFWKTLKVGYDHFEVTKRPPEVNVCEQKYVFNAEAPAGTTFNPTGACPAMTTPASLTSAMASYERAYAEAYKKAMRKYDGMVWYEPSEAERKAIVAETRKGKELAFAPTGSSLDAGKLMRARDLEKLIVAKQEAEEARKAREVQMAALEKAKRDGTGVPVPQPSPIARPSQTAAVNPQPGRSGGFFSLFSRRATEEAPLAPESLASLPPALQPAAAPSVARPLPAAVVAPSGPLTPAAESRTAAPLDQDDAETPAGPAGPPPVAADQQPAKRPFWKIWG